MALKLKQDSIAKRAIKKSQHFSIEDSMSRMKMKAIKPAGAKSSEDLSISSEEKTKHKRK